jgi:hypothetical protein
MTHARVRLRGKELLAVLLHDASDASIKQISLQKNSQGKMPDKGVTKASGQTAFCFLDNGTKKATLCQAVVTAGFVAAAALGKVNRQLGFMQAARG